MKSVYLDYAAATPVSESVLQRMLPYFSDKFHNPSALYLSAQEIAKDLQSARETVAHQLGARSSEIIFTAGGTEANNLAISGLMERFADGELLVTATEHDSVLAPAERYRSQKVKVTGDGLIDLEDLSAKITDKTVLVSVGYVNSEIGVVQPLQKVRQVLGEIIKERRAGGSQRPLLLHSDACQAGNYLSLQVAKLGVDLMSLNGGKLYGPKQSGGLFVRAGLELSPLIRGGGQEFSLRSGTQNVPAIIGFAAALEESQQLRRDETQRLQHLQQNFTSQLNQRFPAALINGSQTQRIANNVHVTFPGQDNERLMMALDERGVVSAVGSACSASKDTPSHVLKAIGLSDEQARASLRFTFGRTTTADNLDYTIDQLAAVLV